MRFGFQTGEHESGATDRRIRQHPFHVYLHHREHRADYESQQRENRDDRAPVIHAWR